MSEQNAQVERLTLAKAITRGLDDAMADNRKVVLIGEDIGKLGGVYRVTEGLLAKHGQKRVMDSPLERPVSWAPPSAWRCAAIGP